MTRRLLFLFALLASAAANAQQPALSSPDSAATNPTATDAVLHVELSARTLSPGASLLAGVQMRNVSGHDIQIADNVMAQGFHGFEAEVTTVEGHPVPMSRWGRDAMGRLIRTAAITLLPGEEQMAILDVTRAFELAKPGDYVLRVMHGTTRSVPIVFSLVDGAQPDARKAAVADPQRDAAAAEYAALRASAPIQVTGPARAVVARMDEPLSVDLTLTNVSAKPVRFGYRNWVRLEVEFPDGRTVEVFGQKGDRDWNQLHGFSSIAPHDSVVLKTFVQERFTFPAPGRYVLRFWVPRAMSAYTLPVTITETAARR